MWRFDASIDNIHCYASQWLKMLAEYLRRSHAVYSLQLHRPTCESMMTVESLDTLFNIVSHWMLYAERDFESTVQNSFWNSVTVISLNLFARAIFLPSEVNFYNISLMIKLAYDFRCIWKDNIQHSLFLLMLPWILSSRNALQTSRRSSVLTGGIHLAGQLNGRGQILICSSL